MPEPPQSRPAAKSAVSSGSASTTPGKFIYLIGVVVSCVVEVVADRGGQHDQQVDAVHLAPQVGQPDQTVHLLRNKESENSCPEELINAALVY